MTLDLLLQPFEGKRCGDDLSFSPLFDEIQEARRSDDPFLKQGDWVSQLKEADWPELVRLCSDALASRAKDIRLAAWLTEGWGRTRGLAGLADGYRLLASLCEDYWDEIHPLPEDGDFELRIGSLDWLLSQSERLVRDIPITDSAQGCFSFADLASAQSLAAALERNPDDRELLVRSGRITMSAFDAARRDTPSTFFVSGLAQVESARGALEEFARVIGERLAPEGPVFEGVRRALTDVDDTFRRFAGSTARDAGRMSGSGSGTSSASPSPVGAGEDGIRTRAEALVRLREIAAFFRRTEPHSPVAYLADKAAHWGEMPLHEWLQSVVRDQGELARVEELLGVVQHHRSDS
jgi:type VI secretion system protein ImpA